MRSVCGRQEEALLSQPACDRLGIQTGAYLVPPGIGGYEVLPAVPIAPAEPGNVASRIAVLVVRLPCRDASGHAVGEQKGPDLGDTVADLCRSMSPRASSQSEKHLAAARVASPAGQGRTPAATPALRQPQ